MKKILLFALCGLSLSTSTKGQTSQQLKAFLSKQGTETAKPTGLSATIAAKAIKYENPKSTYKELWQLCSACDDGYIIFARCIVNGQNRLYTISVKDDNVGTYKIKYMTPISESAWNKKFPPKKSKQPSYIITNQQTTVRGY